MLFAFMVTHFFDMYFKISYFVLLTEYGEMDTGAPMDTAESAKVRHNMVFYVKLHCLI